MSVSPVFGPIVSGEHVRAAVEETIRTWLPLYLEEFCRQNGIAAGRLPRPRSYVVATELPEGWPSDQMPMVVTTVPGLTEAPYSQGGGQIRARWTVAVGCVTVSTDRKAAHLLSHAYLSCIRTLLIQHQGLVSGFADGVDWLSEGTNMLDSDSNRTIMGSDLTISVQIEDAVNERRGPIDPEVDPEEDPTPPPLVQTVEIVTDSLPD